MTDRRMRIFAFDHQAPAHLSAGLWRHPDDRASSYKDLRYWVEYAQLLEQARFDGIFFADNHGYHDVYQGNASAALADAAQVPALDPFLVVSAMAAVTENLGFGLTGSTTYEHPYALARRFSSLDHLTRGRVGWNVVTSYADSAARNLGTGVQVRHDERYDMAAEYLEVCYKLWEQSWDDDAVVVDKARGVYVDPDRVHNIEHHGRYFDVDGFALTEPSPQRTPVIFQAGGSTKGRALAAHSAEGVFVNALTIPTLKRQVDTLRQLAAEHGRDPQNLQVLQMLNVVCAPTDEQAWKRYEDYRRHVSLAGAMARFSGWTGLDMSQFDPDVPLQNVQTNVSQTAVDLFSKVDPDRAWTPRDIADFVGIGGNGPTLVGSPSSVADQLIQWMNETGVAGFNLGQAVRYQDIADFAELVVPELQRRGVMWTEYEGSTMREKLHGRGQVRLRDDHPARAFTRSAVNSAA